MHRTSQCGRPGGGFPKPKEEGALRRRGGLLLQSCRGVGWALQKDRLVWSLAAWPELLQKQAQLKTMEVKTQIQGKQKHASAEVCGEMHRVRELCFALFCFFNGN